MKKRIGKAKTTGPKKDRAWFEQKVAELKTELEKLPADRQEQLTRELELDEDLLDVSHGTQLKQMKKGGK